MRNAKLIVFIIVLLILIIFQPITYAGALTAKVDQLSALQGSDQKYVGGWERLQLSYQFDNDWYIFGSTESAAMYMMGRAFDYEMEGVGIGIKHPVTENIRVFGQIGYYFVDTPGRHDHNEALEYYANTHWDALSGSYLTFDAYEVNAEDTYGAEIGIEVDYPVSRYFSVGVMGSFRIMKVPTEIAWEREAWDYANTGQRWEIQDKTDLSSFNAGFYATLRF